MRKPGAKRNEYANRNLEHNTSHSSSRAHTDHHLGNPKKPQEPKTMKTKFDQATVSLIQKQVNNPKRIQK